MKGIYGYIDLKTDEIVYIGKDSHIDRDERHRHHLQEGRRNAQPFNSILQNNPERYKYTRIIEGEFDDDALNDLEITYIAAINPEHNYTSGGDGFSSGKNHIFYRHDMKDEDIIDMYVNQGLSTTQIAEKFNTDHSVIRRRLINNNIELRDNCGKNNHMYYKRGKNAPQWKDYPRIVKKGFCNGKQNYGLKYNGKIIKESVYKERLEKKLEELINNG